MKAVSGGIDLGGTKILAAIVDAAGRIHGQHRRATDAQHGPDAAADSMTESLRLACVDAGVELSSLAGLGIAAAGPIDIAAGILTDPPNLHGWKDVPLGAMLQERTGLRVMIENDANAAAIGEHAFGAGKGASDMVYITISTGIGGGFVAGGQIYHGATGSAGEIGHMCILPDGPICGCGRKGCLEALASGTALAREGALAVSQGRSNRLAASLAQHGAVDAETVALAAQAGDAAAQAILASAARYLGIGLLNVVHLLNPELIVIGGGASKIGAPLLDPAIAYLHATAFAVMSTAVRVVPAALGDSSGVLGAAELVHRSKRSGS